jgi:hypothetical protein
MRNLDLLFIGLIIISMGSCNSKVKSADPEKDKRIIFLHHSTGGNIWKGDESDSKLKLTPSSAVEKWFKEYNTTHGTNYMIVAKSFPKSDPYGWKNYPYDYYNIWVKNAGTEPYMKEPTLEILTKEYDLIIWKHCYPVGRILKDTGQPDVNSEDKRVENYKVQYEALKSKMKEFPDTKFLVWTGAALLEENTTREMASRTKEFFDWVKETWDDPGDNIHIWDLLQLETEGGLFMKKEFSVGPGDNHPNKEFAGWVHVNFCNRIVDVIENDGSNTTLTGELISEK